MCVQYNNEMRNILQKSNGAVQKDIRQRHHLFIMRTTTILAFGRSSWNMVCATICTKSNIKWNFSWFGPQRLLSKGQFFLTFWLQMRTEFLCLWRRIIGVADEQSTVVCKLYFAPLSCVVTMVLKCFRKCICWSFKTCSSTTFPLPCRRLRFAFTPGCWCRQTNAHL